MANVTGIICMVLSLWGGMLSAQITIEIASLPGTTPSEDSIFAVGSFNDWDPHDPAFVFAQDSQGHLSLKITTDSFPVEYKVTRGGWNKVEGDVLGNALENRTIDHAPKGDSLLQVHIESWEDLSPVGNRGTVKVLVEAIPQNTPPDAPIYIVGNFNSWHPGDPKYRLQAREDGAFEVEVPVIGETLEYKFCRGNWETVEGRRSGRARYNRVHEYSEGKAEVVVEEIETWEDISGNPINAVTFIWLLSGVVGILLLIAINTLQNNNKAANRILSILILLLSISLIGRVAIYDREIFQEMPKLLIVPDIILFLYAPVFLVYLRKLLWDRKLGWTSPIWLHFIPFGLHLIAWFPLYTLDKFTFISQNTDLGLRPWFIITGGIALAYNTFYWFYLRREIRIYRKTAANNYAYEQNLNFLRTVMSLKALCLIIWLGSYVIGGLDRALETDLQILTERSQDLLFIVFSSTVFCLGYFAIREPEIFSLPPELEAEPAIVPALVEVAPEPEEKEDWEEMMDKLRQLMETERPYLNPKLTLAALADLAGTNVHTLSRVINEGFGVNFNDFVNGYRVQEFKDRVVQEEYKHHTLLSVALMAGFNSKTAFNRSFKKITQLTPREYLNQEAREAS